MVIAFVVGAVVQGHHNLYLFGVSVSQIRKTSQGSPGRVCTANGPCHRGMGM